MLVWRTRANRELIWGFNIPLLSMEFTSQLHLVVMIT
jgi:hypothetical protein